MPDFYAGQTNAPRTAGIETLGPLWRFLLRHEQLLRSLPSSEIVYVAETKRHFPDAGRMLSRTFPKLDATTVAARECPRGVDYFLSYLEAREVFEEGLVSPTFEQSQILAEGGSIYRTAAHDQLFEAWMRDGITDEEIVARYSEKRINISIRGYVIRAAFPQTAPSIGEWSSSMVLVAFLGSRLGTLARNQPLHKQMPRRGGEGQIRKRAGTTPPLAAARRRTRWSFPPFGRREWSTAGSKPDRFGIPN